MKFYKPSSFIVNKTIYLIFSLLLFYTINSYGQSDRQYEQFTQTFGYLKGQNYKINYIKREFPSLKPSVIQQQLLFKSRFGNAAKTIDYIFKKALENKYDLYVRKLKQKLKEVINFDNYTKKDAVEFISILNNRANGQIESPILETLLFFQYKDEPEKEFINGYTYDFNTKGHEKSKNTQIKLKIPKSWKALEAERPNIVKTFRSRNGFGDTAFMLLIKRFDKKEYKSNNEFENFFKKEEINDIIPDNGKFISYKPVTIEGLKSGILEYKLVKKRLDKTFKLRTISFITITENKFVQFNCGINITKEEIYINKFKPLFRLIVNSLVIVDKY